MKTIEQIAEKHGSLKTPRGTFRFGFRTTKDAIKAGYDVWFVYCEFLDDHLGHCVVVRDGNAYAVVNPV